MKLEEGRRKRNVDRLSDVTDGDVSNVVASSSSQAGENNSGQHMAGINVYCSGREGGNVKTKDQAPQAHVLLEKLAQHAKAADVVSTS